MLVSVIVLILVFHFKIQDVILRSQGTCIVAKITNSKPFRSGRKDTYEYEFTYNGKKYRGNSWSNDRTRVGKEMQVVFLHFFPSINRSIDGYFNGDFVCSKTE